MTADALKSGPITNLDASPVVPNSSGMGAPGDLKRVNGHVVPTAAGLADTTSKYKMVRLPSNCKLKRLHIVSLDQLDSNASPTLTIDVGAYYSDSTVDGTQPTLQGTAIGAASFLSNTAFAHSSGGQDVDAMAAVTLDKRNKELWDMLGLTSDPAGYIDVVVAVHAAAATAVASKNVMAEADFIW